MNPHTGKWSGILGSLLLATLFLIGATVWQAQPVPTKPGVAVVHAPVDQEASPLPPGDSAFFSPIPPPIGSRPPEAPPFCTFAGKTASETVVTESVLDDFVFSEPTIVLTDEVGSDILGWLPNSNQLFIVRYHPDQPLRVIETWDTATGELRQLATQTFLGGRPFWVDSSGVVAYRETEILNPQTGEYRTNLWVSAPGSDAVTETLQDLRAWNFSISDRGEIIRFAQTTDRLEPLPETMRGAFQEIVIPADLATLLYDKYPWEVSDGYRPKEFSGAHSPDGRLLALYADPYLYLYDIAAQSICEVRIGKDAFRYPLQVQWSPDGQTLAMLTTDTPSGSLVESPKVILLNVATGEQKQLQIEGDPVGISWGTDNRHLLVMSRLDSKQWPPIDKLFLVDTWSGATRLLFPGQIWGGGSRFDVSDVAWSPNGQEIAMKCPNLDEKEGILVEDRICLIATKTDR